MVRTVETKDGLNFFYSPMSDSSALPISVKINMSATLLLFVLGLGTMNPASGGLSHEAYD